MSRTDEVFGREWVSVVGQAKINNWNRVAELSSLFLFAFVMDAAIASYRRGDKRQTLAVGVAITIVFLVAVIHTAMLHLGLIHAPYIVGMCMFALILAIGVELSLEVLREAKLAQELEVEHAQRISDEKFRHAVEAALGNILLRWTR